MLGSTISGIAAALSEIYGQQCGVQSGSGEINPELPYFKIVPLRQSRVPEADTRYRQYQSFEIIYFPQDSPEAPACINVLTQLFDSLEYILIEGNKSRGDKMEGEIKEGVLHFYIQYNLFLVKKQEAEWMEEAAISLNVESGEQK